MEILETNLVAHSDCLDLLRNTQFGLPSTQTDSSSRLLRVPKFVPEDVADIVTASLHRVKYARGLLVYLNVFWSTGTCYRLRGCCACISATAPRLADSFRNIFRSAWFAIFRIEEAHGVLISRSIQSPVAGEPYQYFTAQFMRCACIYSYAGTAKHTRYLYVFVADPGPQVLYDIQKHFQRAFGLTSDQIPDC